VAHTELTSEALKAHDLNTKIDMLKTGKCGDHTFMESLDTKELTACWKRFEFGRSKSDVAKEHWDAMKTMGRGENKDQKKRLLLMAFLKEGKCGERYLSSMESLQVGKEDEKNLRWVPWEECKRWYGEQEAKSRVSSGTIPVRKCPKDSRFFEFLLVTDISKLTKVQKRIVETATKSKLSKSEYKNLAQGILGEHSDESLADFFNMAETSAGVSLKDLQAEQSEEEAASDDLNAESLHPDLKKLMDKGAGKDKPTKQAASLNSKLEKLSTMGDDATLDVAFSKCAQMHSLVHKQYQDIRKLSAAMARKNRMDGTLSQQVQGCIATLNKCLTTLDTAVVDRKGTLASVKKVLVETGKASKKASLAHEKLKEIAKDK
jgi:hypothetical protein